MKIPFFDLKRQYEELKPELQKRVLECLDDCNFIGGPEVGQLEKRLAEYLNVKHVITCGNGTDALQLALKAYGIGPGDEVITSAFSFFASPESISSVGATPVFADIDPVDLNMDPDSVRSKITDRTKALLPVHIFGRPAKMDEINEIAKEYNLIVIDDACQAIGAEYKQRKIGGIAGTEDKQGATAFSFYPTKNLGAYGDGGMVTTNDDDIATILRALKVHAGGKNGYNAAKALGKVQEEFVELKEKTTDLYDPYKYYNYLIGGNSRLDTIQATILNLKLDHLDEYNNKRGAIASRYIDELEGLPIGLPPKNSEDSNCCWHQFAIMTDRKEELIAYLTEEGIGVGAFYPVPLHLQKAFADLGYKEGDLPYAETACKQSVCLPVFPELKDEEVDYIIEKIKAFFA